MSSISSPEKKVQVYPAATHTMCLSLDILGINHADRGRSCEVHTKCGLSLEENSLVRIRREVSAY